MPTPTVNLSISNISFQQVPQLSTATLNLLSISPPSPLWATLLGNEITIVTPQPGGVSLAFQLNDPDYTLIGIDFVNGPAGCVGRTEFPSVALSRTTTSSTMVVTDNDVADQDAPNGLYTFLILVQQTSTGLLGSIDPRVKNDL
jgi:hypothetical protein